MIQISINPSQVNGMLKKFPEKMQYALNDALDHIKLSFFKKFNDTRLKGRPGIFSRPRGIRLRFKAFPVLYKNRRVGMEFYFNRSKVAVKQEEGQWMTGSSGRRIAVPLSARAYKILGTNGYVKPSYKETARLQGKSKNIRPMRFKGQWYLSEVKTRRGKQVVTPLFVLKDKVWNPARLGWYKTWKAHQPRVMEILNQAASKATAEAAA